MKTIFSYICNTYFVFNLYIIYYILTKKLKKYKIKMRTRGALMAEMNLFRPFEPALDNASEGKL